MKCLEQRLRMANIQLPNSFIQQIFNELIPWPGTVPDFRNTAVNQSALDLMELTFQWRKQNTNKINK